MVLIHSSTLERLLSVLWTGVVCVCMQTPMQRLVRRMTRFFVKTDPKETLHQLTSIFTSMAGYTVRSNTPTQVHCNHIIRT